MEGDRLFELRKQRDYSLVVAKNMGGFSLRSFIKGASLNQIDFLHI